MSEEQTGLGPEGSPGPVVSPGGVDGRSGVSFDDHASERPSSPPRRRPTHRWPLLVVLAVVAVGLVVVALGAWRLGCVVVGAALAVGAVERIALPRRNAGLLQVRGRGFDIAVMLGLAVTIVVLAVAVPEGRH